MAQDKESTENKMGKTIIFDEEAFLRGKTETRTEIEDRFLFPEHFLNSDKGKISKSLQEIADIKFKPFLFIDEYKMCLVKKINADQQWALRATYPMGVISRYGKEFFLVINEGAIDYHIRFGLFTLHPKMTIMRVFNSEEFNEDRFYLLSEYFDDSSVGWNKEKIVSKTKNILDAFHAEFEFNKVIPIDFAKQGAKGWSIM